LKHGEVLIRNIYQDFIFYKSLQPCLYSMLRT